MLLTQPPECRSRFTNLVQNFFFTHKIVVHIFLHTFLLHQVCLAVTGHGISIFNLRLYQPLVNYDVRLPHQLLLLTLLALLLSQRFGLSIIVVELNCLINYVYHITRYAPVMGCLSCSLLRCQQTAGKPHFLFYFLCRCYLQAFLMTASNKITRFQFFLSVLAQLDI